MSFGSNRNDDYCFDDYNFDSPPNTDNDINALHDTMFFKCIDALDEIGINAEFFARSRGWDAGVRACAEVLAAYKDNPNIHDIFDQLTILLGKCPVEIKDNP